MLSTLFTLQLILEMYVLCFLRRKSPAQFHYLHQNTSHRPGLSLLPPLLCLTLSLAIQTSTPMMPMEKRVCDHLTAAEGTKPCPLLLHMLRGKHFNDPLAILPLIHTPSRPPQCSPLLPLGLCLSARRLQEFLLIVSMCQWVVGRAPWHRNSAVFTVAVTSDLSHAIWINTTPTSRTCALPWSKRVPLVTLLVYNHVSRHQANSHIAPKWLLCQVWWWEHHNHLPLLLCHQLEGALPSLALLTKVLPQSRQLHPGEEAFLCLS